MRTEVLGELLRGIFADLPPRHGEDRVASAAEILSAAGDLVGEELFLVNVDELDCEGRRPF